ncbi:septum formation initiator family protein [Patescibacteria group bacterium]|nr:septum formation initiator family protein [Patescibacteria group bacterium]MBU2036031.1 septum formation initiator family protein [Patescibacteria group bacterium]
MKRKNNQEITDFFKRKVSDYSKYLLIFGVIIVAISLVRNIIRAIDIRNRIKDEEKKVEVLRKEKEELEKKVAEVESDAYVEKQLRDKLGLAKEGEIVLILPEDEILKKIAPILEEEEDLLPDPTWKKWLKLFI